MITEEDKEWNEKAKSFHKKIIDTRINIFKIFCVVISIIIALGFLSGYFIKIYYHDLYRDILTSSNICAPQTNMTLEGSLCSCGSCNVDCKCITPEQLKDILNASCPEIRIYLNQT